MTVSSSSNKLVLATGLNRKKAVPVILFSNA